MPSRFLKYAGPLAIVASFALLGAGCSLGAPKKTVTGPDAGAWKTADHGQTWVNKKALVDGPRLTAGAAELAVQGMAMDPQDRAAIYLATKNSGLVYSLDGGDSWQRFKLLEATDVKAVAVDSKNKCTIYATSANRIFKTETCGRDWQMVFFDPRTDKFFTNILVDWFNPTIMYAGTNDGDIFKSVDEGVSWQSVKRANAGITSMVISPQDSRIIYAGTDGDGIWKTLDGGITWLQIKKEFADVSEARRVVQVAVDNSNANRVYVVHKTGIVRSDDQGATWSAMPLLTDTGEGKITWLAVDPNNPKNLVYVGPAAIVYSIDGGEKWEAKKLPTTSQGSVVMVDPKDGNIIYMGTIPVKKK